MKTNIVWHLSASWQWTDYHQRIKSMSREKKFIKPSRGNINNWSKYFCAVCVNVRGCCVCVCAADELGSAVYGRCGQSHFNRKLEPSVSGGWYSPCKLERSAHTWGCLHSHWRDWFISHLNYWSIAAAVRSVWREGHIGVTTAGDSSTNLTCTLPTPCFSAS